MRPTFQRTRRAFQRMRNGGIPGQTGLRHRRKNVASLHAHPVLEDELATVPAGQQDTERAHCTERERQAAAGVFTTRAQEQIRRRGGKQADVERRRAGAG